VDRHQGHSLSWRGLDQSINNILITSWLHPLSLGLVWLRSLVVPSCILPACLYLLWPEFLSKM
jgi:hypothetical protein